MKNAKNLFQMAKVTEKKALNLRLSLEGALKRRKLELNTQRLKPG